MLAAPAKSTTLRRRLYLSGFLLAITTALPAYINSSFLSQFYSQEIVGWLFSAAAALTIILTNYSGWWLKRFGLKRTTQVFIIVAFLAGLTLAQPVATWLLASCFILLYGLEPTIRFNLDIYLESLSSDRQTGAIRGLSLVMINLAWLLAPATAGWLVGWRGYGLVYLVAVAGLLPLLWLVYRHFAAIAEPRYEKLSFWEGLKIIWCHDGVCDRTVRHALIIGLLLNIFYAVMVVYTPLYLNQVIGFNWQEIGLIFTIMLLPFPILDYPLGKLADERFGEKEILSLGLVIAGAATLGLAFLHSETWWVWAIVLFASRVGAAAIEVMSESYFFKHIGAQNVRTLSFFRNSAPLAYIIAPPVASLVLAIGNFQWLFVTVALVLFFGLRYSLTLIDTK